jgi:hypothetical protein
MGGHTEGAKNIGHSCVFTILRITKHLSSPINIVCVTPDKHRILNISVSLMACISKKMTQ